MEVPLLDLVTVILVEEVDLQMEAQEEKVLCFLHPRQLEVDGQLTRVREVISGALRPNLGVITAEEPQDRVKEVNKYLLIIFIS